MSRGRGVLFSLFSKFSNFPNLPLQIIIRSKNITLRVSTFFQQWGPGCLFLSFIVLISNLSVPFLQRTSALFI